MGRGLFSSLQVLCLGDGTRSVPYRTDERKIKTMALLIKTLFSRSSYIPFLNPTQGR